MVIRTMIGVIITSTTVAAAGEVPAVLNSIPVDWGAFIERFGITVALLLFFVWRDYKNTRELKTQNDELGQRLRAVESAHHKDLKDVLERSIVALQASSSATSEVKAAVEHCRRVQ